MEQLELEFFSTGEEQHVFVHAGDAERAWLYKIPAAFGRVLPRQHAMRSHALKGRIGKALLRIPVVDRLDAAYMRVNKRNRHLYSVDMLLRLERLGIADVVLPFRFIRDAEATLRIGETCLAYRGHVLMQRRAEFFWERFVNLRALDWEQLVDAQYRMWRHGVGLASFRDALGPRCWARLDGHVALADTGSLTTLHGIARAALDPAALERRIAKHLAQADPREPVREYLDFVSARITRRAFDERWATALPGGGASLPHTVATAAR